MTLAEGSTKYGVQVSWANQLGGKTSRTYDGIDPTLAIGYMAANGQETRQPVDRFNAYFRALAALSENGYSDCYLTGKTSTNEVLAALIAG